MMFDGINLLGVLLAAVGSFIFGAVWYGALGKAWINSVKLTPELTKPTPLTMAIAFLCQLFMSFVLAGLIYHLGGGLTAGLISAFMIWSGFILTSQIVNHRFQGAPWLLTLIDCSHWFGVLIIQAIILSYFS
ncbi:DUF1761 domain-containing protein [Roseibium algae]|uniref:DUF1761 domain-containing protein n=1 Tax=Roseibium algae TaxID=3123038 RepID=A0ABU8TL79_9HYPH